MAHDRASRPEAKALRLFVAIDLPEDVQDEVDRAIGPWREAFPRARWAPRGHRHVTLKFLGQTWPRLSDWVPEQVGVVAATSSPFDTRLRGLGAFPSPGRARVLWAGLDDDNGRMAGLASALDEVLAKEFRPETRAFAPHLTVARSEPPVGLPEGFGLTRVEPVSFRVDHLTLFRSYLQRPAPRYEPLGVFRLGG